jgi:branched-chain amino acid transport system substrate-binding protein
MRTLDRRQALKAGTSTLALAAGAVAMPAVLRAQAGPIKIGLMSPLTGVLAAGGKELVEGFELWWEKNGKEIAGRKIEITVEDDASNPDTALQKARKLVEQSNVHFLIGNILANTGLAVANYVKGNGVPYFIPVIAADDLTQRQRIPNVLRVAGYTGSQMTRPLGDWAIKQGYKKVATISQDYAYGHEMCGGFCQTFSESGGSIVQQFWHPLNTADFSPYLGQIAGLGVDAIFAMETGADGNRYLQQWKSFGLKGKIPLLGAMNLADQSVIRTLSDEAVDVVTSAAFSEGGEDEATKSFVGEYEKRYQKLPSVFGTTHFSGAKWLTEAITKIGGKVEDREALLKAVREHTLTGSPLGPEVKMDQYGHPVYTAYIRKVVKRADGKQWNVPIASYPGVSQFWKYDPETYMKQPSYSRTFQGIKT